MLVFAFVEPQEKLLSDRKKGSIQYYIHESSWRNLLNWITGVRNKTLVSQFGFSDNFGNYNFFPEKNLNNL